MYLPTLSTIYPSPTFQSFLANAPCASISRISSWTAMSIVLFFFALISSAAIQSSESKYIAYNTTHRIVPEKLNVHLVPHSHDDVGWLKTVDQYYVGANNSIRVHRCYFSVLPPYNLLFFYFFLFSSNYFYWPKKIKFGVGGVGGVCAERVGLCDFGFVGR